MSEFLQAIDLKDKPISQLSCQELEKLKQLKNYAISPAGNFGYTKAEVTRGGVCTNEIEAQTLQSRHQKGVYFLGEALDVTGELGGYNFQWAFSSAYKCAKNWI